MRELSALSQRSCQTPARFVAGSQLTLLTLLPPQQPGSPRSPHSPASKAGSGPCGARAEPGLGAEIVSCVTEEKAEEHGAEIWPVSP